MITIVALAILVFLNPVWVGFEQDRTGAAALTGFDPATVHTVTNSILHDLVFGPPRFDVTVGGQAVLGVREQAHMVDVRGVFFMFGALALLAILVLVNVAMFSRAGPWFRRAVRSGAALLALLVVVLGAIAAVAFDTVFETFHELFFPAGSFDFEATSKLIQLFPDQFWFETSLALGGVILAVCGIVAFLARSPASGALAAAPAGTAA
jgi:integral membrane protein (TIGR01906 family)